MRIFLSYGHDGYTSLALRIKRDLETRGHEVWFDVERLKPGGDWERYIEDGLDFASAVPDAGRFLVLLTPHSVRRPDGYCLNELARAFGRNLPIIPVMVSTVELPLSICRLQWLDMRNCFPAEQHEGLYSKQFEQLLRSLEEKQVPFEGVQQRLLSYLQPISYGDDLTLHLAHFTGREWVMTEVEQWLASSRRVLWITGEAGVGKSALGAWLCDKRPEIVAYHFCRFGNSDRVDARKALFSLAYQLSTQLPAYQDRMNASQLDKTVIETNVPTVFDRLFVNLLSDAVPLADKPQVLFIDALDEATRNGRNELASLIGAEFHRLPPWLRVIVTSRPYEQEINFALQALDPWKLDAGRSENLDDIRKYLRSELQPFTGDGLPSEQAVDAVVEKSEGLFLYAGWVRQELQDGRLSLARVEDFPQGLAGIYAQWFERYFPDVSDYETRCRPVLEAVCAAREPLARDDIVAIFGWSEYQMKTLIARLGSLFPVADGRLRPFHQSVRDWLTNSAQSGSYYVDVNVGERRLADYVCRQCQAGIAKMSRYSVLHGPAHLASRALEKDLANLLLDYEWIEAKLGAADVAALLVDYDLAALIHSRQSSRKVQKKWWHRNTVVLPHRAMSAFCTVVRRVDWSSNRASLTMLQEALRLSAHVLALDAAQVSSQLSGRLSPTKTPKLKALLDQARRSERAGILPLRATLTAPGGPLIRTLSGHSTGVHTLALSAHQQRVVSASWDKTLKVWDVESGRELHTLKGHFAWVNGVAVSADGRLAVSAHSDHTLKVWDVENGRELRTLAGHADLVNAVAIAPNGRLAVSASSDNTLKVWDVESGRELSALTGHSGGVTAVAVLPDGQRAVSASPKELKVWDLQSGREVRTVETSHETVSRMAVSADGRLAVSAWGEDGVLMWNLESGRKRVLSSLSVWNTSSESSDAIATDSRGRLAVSVAGNMLRVWNLTSSSVMVFLANFGWGRKPRALMGHTDWIWDVAVSPNAKVAVSASEDKTVKVWNLSSGRKVRALTEHSSSVNCVTVGKGGKLVASASDDHTVKLWNLASGRLRRTFKGHSDEVRGVAMSVDGRLAVSASADNTLKVWSVETGCALRTLRGHLFYVNGVAISADGRLAVSASADNTLIVWDVKGGCELQTLAGHHGSVTGVAVDPAGRLAVSASEDRTVKVWELASGRELRTLEGHTGPVNGVALVGDGQRAVSASSDGTLKVWDLQSGRDLRTLKGHTDGVNAVAVMPDGQRAVSASDDQTLKVWRFETGEVLGTFTCDSAAYCCAFSDARNVIVAGDGGGHVHFLRLEEGKNQ